LAVEKPSAAVSTGLMGAGDAARGGKPCPMPRRETVIAGEF
jgi:hypothetical protein